ncbi:MAG: YeeE/YedE family protein [Xanthomonadales bacterium]|nr:YeeE/YedE family protein [Xanthomonadales bacterium]
MTEFTPFSAILGGALIGLVATLLMLSFGRIAGASGIATGVVTAARGDRSWRVAFLLGALASSTVVYWFTPIHFEFRTDYPHYMTIISGLLVGFGASLGSGCTSGHGVCGLARLSRRSILATIVFFLFSAISVYLGRHVWQIIP